MRAALFFIVFFGLNLSGNICNAYDGDFDLYVRLVDQILLSKTTESLFQKKEIVKAYLKRKRESNKNDFTKDVLKLILKDIEKLEEANLNTREEIFKITRKMSTLEPSITNFELLPKSDLMSNYIKKMGVFFGSKSYYVYISKFYYIQCKIIRREFDGTEKLLQNYSDDYTYIFGDKNIETTRPLALYILYYAAKKDWKKYIDYSKLVYEYQIKNTDDEETILSPSSHLLFAYAKNKQFENAIIIFNKIPLKFTDDLNRDFSKQQFRIFSGMSDVWEYKENFAKSLAYQELALIAISATKDISDSEVIDEAKKLRDKYEKAGEWKSLRNLEERHKLKPLPKNPAEK